MTGLLPSMPRLHWEKVYGKSYLEMYLLLPQLITLICYRAILQCFVVIRNKAIMSIIADNLLEKFGSEL